MLKEFIILIQIQVRHFSFQALIKVTIVAAVIVDLSLISIEHMLMSDDCYQYLLRLCTVDYTSFNPGIAVDIDLTLIQDTDLDFIRKDKRLAALMDPSCTSSCLLIELTDL